jgi:hypothetical protein
MSVEQESLSEIIGNRFGGAKAETPAPTGEPADKPAAAAPPAATSEPPVEKTEEKTERVRDESGKFTKAEEKPAEKPAEKPRPDVAAIIDERRKRQEAEKRYADLLAQSQKPGEKPSVFDNEDAAISSRVDEGTRGIRETLYKLSVKAARGIYKDFGEAEAAFSEAMEKDPRLIIGLQQSDDPGEFIYTMGIHVRELADVGGDLMKYREKVTSASQSKIDELAQQITALKAENDALKKAQADLESVPRSLNNTSSGSAPKAGDEDPEDIRSIARFGNQRR